MLSSGSASLSVTSGTVINVTRGEVAKSGPLNRYERYMAVENTIAVVTATSDSQLSYDGDAVIGSGPSGSVTFTDVTDSNWAKSYIEKLANAGYVNGTGNGMFSPSNNMTRADFVTILGRIAGVDPSDYTTSSFTDVAAGTYYAPYVEWAAQVGIVSGMGNNTFAPTSNITRSQMAVIASNYAKYAGISLSDSGDTGIFSDNSSIEDWAYDAVYAMRNAGVINGKPNNIFDPKGTATRAEVCAVICRLIYGDQ